MSVLESFFVWAITALTKYGPILGAINATWSILQKVCALFKGTHSRKEQE